MYIESWDNVEPGTLVIEDTYPEVYILFLKDGKKWLKQTGWQNDLEHKRDVPVYERECNFEPNSLYDQPWIAIG